MQLAPVAIQRSPNALQACAAKVAGDIKDCPCLGDGDNEHHWLRRENADKPEDRGGLKIYFECLHCPAWREDDPAKSLKDEPTPGAEPSVQ